MLGSAYLLFEVTSSLINSGNAQAEIFFHAAVWCVCVFVTQSCPTLCDPIDCSPPGSSVYGILQARIVEWVIFSYSGGSFQPRDWTQVSCIASRLFKIWATRADLHSIQYYAICFLLLKALLWGQSVSMTSTQYVVLSGYNQVQFRLLLPGSDCRFFPGRMSCTLSSLCNTDLDSGR